MSSAKAIEVAVLGGGKMGENVIQHLGDSPLVRAITVFDGAHGAAQAEPWREDV